MKKKQLSFVVIFILITMMVLGACARNTTTGPGNDSTSAGSVNAEQTAVSPSTPARVTNDPINLGVFVPGSEVSAVAKVGKAKVTLDENSSKWMTLSKVDAETVKVSGKIPDSVQPGQIGSFRLTAETPTRIVVQTWTFKVADLDLSDVNWNDGTEGRFTQAYETVNADTTDEWLMAVRTQLVLEGGPHYNADYAFQEKLQLESHPGAKKVVRMFVWGTASDFITEAGGNAKIWNGWVLNGILNQKIGIAQPAGWFVIVKELDNGDYIYELTRCGNWLTTNKVVDNVDPNDPNRPPTPPDETPKLDPKNREQNPVNQNGNPAGGPNGGGVKDSDDKGPGPAQPTQPADPPSTPYVPPKAPDPVVIPPTQPVTPPVNPPTNPPPTQPPAAPPTNQTVTDGGDVGGI